MNTAPMSDEVAAHAYRIAQASRLLRYCKEIGVDAGEVLAGRVVLDLDPISDARGMIVPEAQDFA